MSLPYWVEYLLTVPRKDGKTVGNLVRQYTTEYYVPVVPPATEFYFASTPAPYYAGILYRLYFGYMVPGTIKITAVVRGTTMANTTIQGHHLENGFDMFFCQAPPDEFTAYVANISPVNQIFQMVGESLRIDTEEDYIEIRDILDKMRGVLPMQYPR